MKSPLRVGVVCFSSLGGSGVVASEQALGLARRGHRVFLLSRGRPARVTPEDTRLTVVPVELPEYPLFDYPPYTVALASALMDLARTQRLDVMHVHYAVPHAVSALVAKTALGVEAPAWVTSLHGTDVLKVGTEPAYRSATCFAVGASDAVVAPSGFLRDEARRLLALPPTLEVEVLPNFVDTDRFSPATSRPDSEEAVLFHVSNFRPLKRVQDVLQVFARVQRQRPARLVLVGDGPERPAAESLARALGVADRVRFAGKQDDFTAELRQADVFVLPSEVESFGVAALEALSSGVPVCGYRVGGLPELITDEVGALVTPLDVEALTEAVLGLLATPARLARAREAARSRALQHYRVEPAVERYEAFLRSVVERARRSKEEVS